MIRFEDYKIRAKNLTKYCTCETCIDKDNCNKKEDCIIKYSNFHRYWRGKNEREYEVQN